MWRTATSSGPACRRNGAADDPDGIGQLIPLERFSGEREEEVVVLGEVVLGRQILRQGLGTGLYRKAKEEGHCEEQRTGYPRSVGHARLRLVELSLATAKIAAAELAGSQAHAGEERTARRRGTEHPSRLPKA